MRRRFVYAVLGSTLLHGLIASALLLLARPVNVLPSRASLPADELSVSLTGPLKAAPPATPLRQQTADMPLRVADERDETGQTFLDPGFGSPYDLPALYSIFDSRVDLDWYPVEALDVRAEPMHEVLLPPLPDGLSGPGLITLEVFIDEFGLTDHVDILHAEPAAYYDDIARDVFMAARWSPAIKDGRFVRSRKLIEVCLGDCSGKSTEATGRTDKGILAP